MSAIVCKSLIFTWEKNLISWSNLIYLVCILSLNKVKFYWSDRKWEPRLGLTLQTIGQYPHQIVQCGAFHSSRFLTMLLYSELPLMLSSIVPLWHVFFFLIQNLFHLQTFLHRPLLCLTGKVGKECLLIKCFHSLDAWLEPFVQNPMSVCLPSLVVLLFDCWGFQEQRLICSGYIQLKSDLTPSFRVHVCLTEHSDLVTCKAIDDYGTLYVDLRLLEYILNKTT